LTSRSSQADQELSQAEARALLLACPNDGFAVALREVLPGCRCGGWLTIAEAAEIAEISVRSLQRRLAAEDWTFLRLADQARAELAKELLQRGDHPLLQIAHELGYSESQNFIRAFKRWTGQTPEQYRRGLSEQFPVASPLDG
jgi:AraC-like DNA-binding protein